MANRSFLAWRFLEYDSLSPRGSLRLMTTWEPEQSKCLASGGYDCGAAHVWIRLSPGIRLVAVQVGKNEAVAFSSLCP